MKIVKILGIVVVCLVVAVVAFIAFRNHQLLDARLTGVAVTAPPAVEGEEAVARGKHTIYAVMVCAECHGADLAGSVMVDDPKLGRLVAPNITTLHYSDTDWARIIRHGLTPEGRAVIVMPSQDYALINTSDLADAIAYLKTLQPIARELPPLELRTLGRFLIAIGELHVSAFHIDHVAAEKAAAPVSESVYLASVSGCSSCHVEDPKGREPLPGLLAPSRIAASMQRYDRATFEKAVRAGVKADGGKINPLMPYASYASLSDAEIDRLFTWLKPSR